MTARGSPLAPHGVSLWSKKGAGRTTQVYALVSCGSWNKFPQTVV